MVMTKISDFNDTGAIEAVVFGFGRALGNPVPFFEFSEVLYALIYWKSRKK
jgi:hypothetical protein